MIQEGFRESFKKAFENDTKRSSRMIQEGLQGSIRKLSSMIQEGFRQ